MTPLIRAVFAARSWRSPRSPVRSSSACVRPVAPTRPDHSIPRQTVTGGQLRQPRTVRCSTTTTSRSVRSRWSTANAPHCWPRSRGTCRAAPCLPSRIGEATTRLEGVQAEQLLALAQKKYASRPRPGRRAYAHRSGVARHARLGQRSYTVYLSPREDRSLNESLDGGDFGGIASTSSNYATSA